MGLKRRQISSRATMQCIAKPTCGCVADIFDDGLGERMLEAVKVLVEQAPQPP